MLKKTFSIILLINSLVLAQAKIKVGADLLIPNYFNQIKSHRLGLIVNHTSLLSNGVNLVDALFSTGYNISVLFAPEHGIRGDYSAGESVTNGKDERTGIPVISLYGKVKKPTKEMLHDTDLLIFDIQDTGARFYTYISTLYYCMQSAIENDIPIMVLDRPNPVTGIKTGGPLIEKEYISFIGIAPLPIMHGMTIGELALYFNHLLKNKYGKEVHLQVIKMEGWQREFYYDDCGIPWVNPSPNIVDLNTALVYPGLCLLEGTNVSEGRGTTSPFTVFGAPFIDSQNLMSELKRFDIPAIDFEETTFTPKVIPGAALYPKYKNEKCHGLKLIITNRQLFEPVKFGVILLSTLHRLYPGDFQFNKSHLDKLFGSDYLRKMIINNSSPELIISKWADEIKEFNIMRKEFLLY